MWPRLKNSPHTYAHEGLESIFLFEFIELQWVQTDFLRLSDNNIFGSFPHKMPFDYQMVTYEEIIKNDFLKWAQLVKTTAFVDLKLNIKYFTKAVVSNFL